MRVIAGSKKGTVLQAPTGEHTRPTTDRTKETLFNVLMPYVRGSSFLDLFGGSGAIAIEALSRGADTAVIVENDKRAVSCIRRNLEKTGFTKPKARLFQNDVDYALKLIEREGMSFDLVFMDPPYNMGLERDVLTRLRELSVLREEAIVVVEASKDTDFSYLEQLSYKIWKNKDYKTNRHLFLSLA